MARIAKLELGYSCDKTMSTLKIHMDGDKRQLCHGSQVHFVYAILSHEGLRQPNVTLLLNPLSPNIHIQILQTDLYTFPLRIS